jgi:hypothetical protein
MAPLRATNTSNLGASAISFVPLAKGIAISSERVAVVAQHPSLVAEF